MTKIKDYSNFGWRILWSSGLVPVFPNSNYKSEWTDPLMIYKGQICINPIDEKIWFCSDTQIVEIVNNSSSGYVPYIGAITDVDLGANNLTAEKLFTTVKDNSVQIGTTTALGEQSWVVFGGGRSMIGYNGVTRNAVIQGAGSKGIEFNVNNATFGSGTAMVVASNGNVGIGETTPLYKLHIKGSSQIRLDTGNVGYASTISSFYSYNKPFSIYVDNYGDVLSVGKTIPATTTPIPYINGYYGSAILGDDTLGVYVDGHTGTPGNVGIGTTSPTSTSKLHVYAGSSGGAASSAANTIIEDSGSNILQLLAPDTAVQGIMFGDTRGSFEGYIRYAHTDREMSFYSAGSKRLILDSSGNLGISSNTPIAKLDVVGGDIYFDQNQGIYAIDNRAGTPTVRNVISSMYPDVSLGALGSLTIGVNSNRCGAIFFSTQNGTKQMTFSQGKLGLGVVSTEPSEKLEVVGNIALSGDIYRDSEVYIHPKIISVTASTYTLNETDNYPEIILLVKADCTVTIDTDQLSNGTPITIKVGGDYEVDVETEGSEQIDGEDTQTLYQYDSMQMFNDGSNWFVK